MCDRCPSSSPCNAWMWVWSGAVLRAQWVSVSPSPQSPAMAVCLSKDKDEALLLGLPRSFRAWSYHHQCPFGVHFPGENTLCRSQCYVPAGSHLCTVQGAVLPQFPLPVKHKPRLTEAAFPRAVQPLTDASRCDPKKNKRERA